MRLEYLLIDLFECFETTYTGIEDYFRTLMNWNLNHVENVIRGHIEFSSKLPLLFTLTEELSEIEYIEYKKLYISTFMNHTTGTVIPAEVLAAKQHMGKAANYWTPQNERYMDYKLRQIFKGIKTGQIQLDEQEALEIAAPQLEEGSPLDLAVVSFDQVMADYERSEN